jgi:hypothetical protein
MHSQTIAPDKSPNNDIVFHSARQRAQPIPHWFGLILFFLQLLADLIEPRFEEELSSRLKSQFSLLILLFWQFDP